MKIKFNINYKTKYGQNIRILGTPPELGDNNVHKSKKMFPKNGEKGDWDIIIEKISTLKFTYRYYLEDEHGKIILKSNEKYFDGYKFSNLKKIYIDDIWQICDTFDNIFQTSTFLRVIYGRTNATNISTGKVKQRTLNLFFNIKNPRVDREHTLGILGNIEELGNWKHNKIVLFSDKNFPIWQKILQISTPFTNINYKYYIIRKKDRKIVAQENHIRTLTTTQADLIIRNDESFNFLSPWKAAGVAIPVFSIRSKNGFGTGEFLDINLLVDWAKKTGLKMIQVLPINDTTATYTKHDSYPYAAISIFALHPLYLHIDPLLKFLPKKIKDNFKSQKIILNQKKILDYEYIIRKKIEYLKLIYAKIKDKFLQNKKFIAFFNKNSYWLTPYATFSYLRDTFGTTNFEHWKNYQKPTKEILSKLMSPQSPHYQDIMFHCFVQYQLHKQLTKAVKYARKNNIILKGDIPIGVYKYSVDTWIEPNLFNMNQHAGAPPDDFSDIGQNWGFPTYNWDAMRKNNYQWWQNRMKKMSEYFDAFRIDHILGFFRIWEIPSYQRQGILGYFNPSIPFSKKELEKNDINFNYKRYCTPYIRSFMMKNIFGEHSKYVKDTFLIEYEKDKFNIKEEYNTQKKLEKMLAKIKTPKIIAGMYELISEVLFIEYPFATQASYIPRHSLYKTQSFKNLSSDIQKKIMTLYEDYYFAKNEKLWKQQGLQKLPAIKNATGMLICGEDLGMIPQCVAPVMKKLNILSLEIQRMPKNINKEFEHPNNFPYLSVATPSSHDTSTIRGWWEENPTQTQRYYNQILKRKGNAPFFCEPFIVKDIINQHLHSKSMWTIFPIQDIIGINANLRRQNPHEERINTPANPHNYWKYRLHIELEELLKQDKLNTTLKNMLIKSNRHT